MMLVGLAVWAAAAAVDALAIWRLGRGQRRPAPGLNTIADVEEFTRELRRPFSVPLAPLEHHLPAGRPASRLRTVPDVPVPAGVEGFAIERAPLEVTLTRTADIVPALTLDLRTPIYDALERERHRRVVALRMPTLEMRVVFDALVDAWLCSHCEVDDCRGCPGCSCSCRLGAVAA